VPLFTPPLDTRIGSYRLTNQLVGVTVENGAYRVSLTKVEKYLRFCIGLGFEYFEFSHLFSQWGAKCAPQVAAKVNGKTQRIFGWDNASDDPKYIELLGIVLPKLVKLTKKLGIFEKSMIHISDEPSEASIETYKKLRNIVKPLVAGMPVCDAASDLGYAEIVDIPFVAISEVHKFIDAHAENFGAYYCCGPIGGYYTNRFISFPQTRIRVLGTMLYLSGAKGFLHWGYNFYHSALSVYSLNPFDSADGGKHYPAGDPFIVYPDFKNNGALPSIRLIAMNQAMDDYRMLEALEQKTSRAYVVSLIGKAGVKGFNQYPHDDSWLPEFFEKVKAEIMDAK